MNRELRKQYGNITLLDIECSEPYGWNEENASYVRVSVPPTYDHARQMLEQGFFLADRTLDVTINLTRSNIDYRRLVRIAPSITSGRNDEVLAIARQSFPADRRFNLSYKPDPSVAETVITGWVGELDRYYLSEIKGKAIGFLALTGGGETRFVQLAAVLERYRPSGAGISLYAAAAYDCKEAGVRFLEGRISSANTAVMNLYAYLGASFSNPLDVYLKERRPTEGQLEAGGVQKLL